MFWESDLEVNFDSKFEREVMGLIFPLNWIDFPGQKALLADRYWPVGKQLLVALFGVLEEMRPEAKSIQSVGAWRDVDVLKAQGRAPGVKLASIERHEAHCSLSFPLWLHCSAPVIVWYRSWPKKEASLVVLMIANLPYLLAQPKLPTVMDISCNVFTSFSNHTKKWSWSILFLLTQEKFAIVLDVGLYFGEKGRGVIKGEVSFVMHILTNLLLVRSTSNIKLDLPVH